MDDSDEKNGVVEYLKGSHKWIVNTTKLNFHAENDYQNPLKCIDSSYGKKKLLKVIVFKNCFLEKEIVRLSVKKGTILAHLQNTWHGSGPVNSFFFFFIYFLFNYFFNKKKKRI